MFVCVLESSNRSRPAVSKTGREVAAEKTPVKPQQVMDLVVEKCFRISRVGFLRLPGSGDE